MTDAPAPVAEVIPLKRRGPPAGRPKPEGSGRKKGVPNKRTAEIAELLASLKCDPISGMARIALNKKNPVEIRARMFAELAQYRFPKRRAIDMGTEDGEPFVFQFVGAAALAVRNQQDDGE